MDSGELGHFLLAQVQRLGEVVRHDQWHVWCRHPSVRVWKSSWAAMEGLLTR